MNKKNRYVMLILDTLPYKTCRMFFWSRYGNAGAGTLTTQITRASVFNTPENAQRAFYNDGGDSYLQQENGGQVDIR